jgi:hypothetical protein
MSDNDQYYSDDGPAYGDDGPAYGDNGPAYGDNGPIGEGYAYSDEVTYGDEGASYQDGAYYDDGGQGYADQPGDTPPLEGPDYAAEAEPVPVPVPPVKPKSKLRLKRIALIAGGLVVVGSLGAAGLFYALAPEGENSPMTLLRAMPVIGEMLGGAPDDAGASAAAAPAAPAATEESSGGPLDALYGLLSFGGGDTMETVAQLEDNVVAVQRAIESYQAERHRLPGTASAIESQLRALNLQLKNPFGGGKVEIELAKEPSKPAAIAYDLKPGRYELRVGDATGKPLKLGESKTMLVIEGTAVESSDANASPEEPATAAVAASDASAPAAVLPSPIGATNAAGIDKLGATPSPGATTLPAVGPPAPLPNVADGGMVPSPSASLTPQQALAVRRQRNLEFDAWRVKGISLVYSARTQEALVAFNKALEIRPNDESVLQWVVTINGVIDKTKSEAQAKYDEEREARLKENERVRSEWRKNVPPPAAYVPPPPRPIRDDRDDAAKMLEELKKADKVPLLAPPKLEP